MKNKILTIVVGTTVLLTSIVLALGTPYAYAQSHYQVGYDDGCAGRVVEGHHTPDYKRGYADGQAACSRGGSGSGDNNIPRPIPNTRPQPLPPNTGPELQDNEESSTSSDINWEDLCNQGTSLGLIHLAQSCSYYAHGTQLTQAGNQALLCLAVC